MLEAPTTAEEVLAEKDVTMMPEVIVSVRNPLVWSISWKDESYDPNINEPEVLVEMGVVNPAIENLTVVDLARTELMALVIVMREEEAEYEHVILEREVCAVQTIED